MRRLLTDCRTTLRARLRAVPGIALVLALAACGGGGGGGAAAVTVTLTATPATISSGAAATLDWTASGASTCTASGGWTGGRTTSGSESTGILTSTTSYTLTCTGDAGTGSDTAAVTVAPPPPLPTVTVTGAPATVASGASATLSWSSTGATACTASGGWSGSRATSGTASTGALAATTTYTLTCTGPGGSAAASTTVTVTPVVGATFPLRVEAGKRYLVTAAGAPFLLHGDTAWSLIVQLNQAQVDQYLDDRAARGFNTLLVNLIERGFSDDPPNNAFGNGPFTTPGDFGTPNEAYFAHADWVLQRAAQKGFLVLLVPAYLGFGGGNEGWYQQMQSSGTTKLRDYGRFLGQRYQGYTNILWTHGGDYNPPNKALVRAIVDGIREFQPTVLNTVHCAPESVALDCWSGEPWLAVNNTYTYNDVQGFALDQYGRAGTVPFFLIESVYEDEQSAPVRRTRVHAWQTLLAGATGQVFGNNPIWHFDAPNPIYTPPVSWPQALGREGSRGMQRLQALFASLDWWTLVPDTGNTLVTGGLGSGTEGTAAARAGDGSFALVYTPQNRMLTVNMAQLSGPAVQARWYDPVSGTFTTVPGSPFPASGSRNFTPTGNNSAGAGDWALLLEST